MSKVGRVEGAIKQTVARILRNPPNDYTVVLRYRENKCKYELAVADGSGDIWAPYIKKEAYRRIAHMRGYIDDKTLAGE